MGHEPSFISSPCVACAASATSTGTLFLPPLLSSAQTNAGASLPISNSTGFQSNQASLLPSIQEIGPPGPSVTESDSRVDMSPVTVADVFSHVLNWLVNWDHRQIRTEESCGPDKALIEWLYSCLDSVWLLVDEDKRRVPFYELLRGGVVLRALGDAVMEWFKKPIVLQFSPQKLPPKSDALVHKLNTLFLFTG